MPSRTAGARGTVGHQRGAVLLEARQVLAHGRVSGDDRPVHPVGWLCGAVQLGKQLGAEVFATSRSAEKLSVASELGAHHTIDTSAVSVVDAVRELTGGRGVDVVFDHLGKVAWRDSLTALTPGGRFVTCGATTGPNPEASITKIFWKQLSILGSTMATKAEFADMLGFVELEGIRPSIDGVLPLDRIADAHRRVESGEHRGKVVLQVS